MFNKKSVCCVLGLVLTNVEASEVTTLHEVTVTATREAEPKSQSSVASDGIDASEISEMRPAHPSEIMGRVPGVYLNVTGGEGHMTAIRQPITTSPVYLYLEDGIPIRSTGFFNHNALYEVNVPQSGGIEVLKGPGSALYGSDAIGGVVNVMTRPAPLRPEVNVDLEGGGHGWMRMLVDGGNTWDSDGIRADINLTRTDGWRTATDYDRKSATLRWDRFLDSGATLKTVLTTSNIDQQTAGSSAISKSDYENNPTVNYTPVSYRRVDALRLSMAYEKESDNSLLSITPYLRSNKMGLLPNWSLSYDPVRYETQNDSLGLLLKYRHDYVPMQTRLIIGADVDYSPGSHQEDSLTVTKVGKIYTDYAVNQTIYDYDVTFQGISPYLHVESSPSDKVRVNGGLRYDHMSYDYNNKLSVVETGSHRRPGSTQVDFNHLSPKLGMSYLFSDTLNGFLAYRHAFRAPSESQLFRQGKAANTVGLKPVKADSYEAGLRGRVGVVSYEADVYYMKKRDDILSYRHADGSTETQNAGETLHRGVEVGADTKLNEQVSLALAYSYAIHSYEVWAPSAGVDYTGQEMASAPRTITNLRMEYRPQFASGGLFTIELEHLGAYWMDDANTHRYPGHSLLHLRGNYPVNKQLTLYARLMNVTDERYATSSSYNTSRGEEFAPGMPRTLYAGVNYAFK